MATYILFWNPAISSYTRERFMEDFKTGGCVGNWSINEYKLPCECEVCGYSYRKAFGRDLDWHNYISPIPSRRLPTLFHTICRSCDEVDDEEIEDVLVRKREA